MHRLYKEWVKEKIVKKSKMQLFYNTVMFMIMTVKLVSLNPRKTYMMYAKSIN